MRHLFSTTPETIQQPIDEAMAPVSGEMGRIPSQSAQLQLGLGPLDVVWIDSQTLKRKINFENLCGALQPVRRTFCNLGECASLEAEERHLSELRFHEIP